MKVGILAGGYGSRLAEETDIRPKPMVEIGGMPILWHIMKYYAEFSHDDFTIALGYKGEYIKRWWLDRLEMGDDISIDMRTREVTRHQSDSDCWKVRLVETGETTNTGGRIKRLIPHLADDGTFLLTWGDGVSTVDLDALVDFHKHHGKIITMSAVHPPSRFGHLDLEGDYIHTFTEKPQMAEGWINGAFFVCEPELFEFIEGDDTPFEHEPLTTLAEKGELVAYRHDGFWQCMDTLRDRRYLENLWQDGDAPWRIW